MLGLHYYEQRCVMQRLEREAAKANLEAAKEALDRFKEGIYEELGDNHEDTEDRNEGSGRNDD